MTDVIDVRVHATSNSDSLSYLGQQAVSDAVGETGDYRIVGGTMVRLLLHVYPTPRATLRSTLDADAAVGDVEVVGHITAHLLAQDFSQEKSNVFAKDLGDDQRVEINLLVSRQGSVPGIRPLDIDGLGRVDSLPELRFVLMSPALRLHVSAELWGGQTIDYKTCVPDVEAAVVLKAHAWKNRRSEKDLADLHSLLEIREQHPDVAWRLNETGLKGFRKDTSLILQELGRNIIRKSSGLPVYGQLDRFRMAGLVARHVTSAQGS
ncbi:nucleotidyl transferase AbiEii/AbiGii toxin family protein [Luteimicrobium xylanilyticum]|uniref:Uncharacterized protein n=1 Tax=Luteimicrobium xylanilyticum TaxID=1133546 RepID=A0A5P9QEA2_9MICO|nr:hypothetical protein [Luteimicrobium xylanilyticum]QFU99808.1 hypothetical protein KDY119_03344 [Luteimicrobium xylanilyticum]